MDAEARALVRRLIEGLSNLDIHGEYTFARQEAEQALAEPPADRLTPEHALAIAAHQDMLRVVQDATERLARIEGYDTRQIEAALWYGERSLRAALDRLAPAPAAKEPTS